MRSTPAVWKQNNKMAVLHFFLVNFSLIYFLFSLIVSYLGIQSKLDLLRGHKGVKVISHDFYDSLYFNQSEEYLNCVNVMIFFLSQNIFCSLILILLDHEYFNSFVGHIFYVGDCFPVIYSRSGICIAFIIKMLLS